jgi:hypothetical protein
MIDTSRRPRVLEAENSGRTLVEALGASVREVSVADGAAKSGLALRDAERGLHWALGEYRGHLNVTSGGDLLFEFPTGFRRPWVVRESLAEAARRLSKGLGAAAKVALKIWILAALVIYAAVFAAILIGLSIAVMSSGRSDDNRSRGRGFTFGDFLMFRLMTDLLSDAIFAFSMRRSRARSFGGGRGRRLYERVSLFIFGPEEPAKDPLLEERRILALIRARSGRIGLIDLMGVTGLPREDAERLATRLVVEYEGELEVGEEGSLVYVFKDLRKTADSGPFPERVSMSWERPVQVAPLTGDNSTGSNVAIAALNGFNLLMSGYAIVGGLTLANLEILLTPRRHGYGYGYGYGYGHGYGAQSLLDASAPLALGWIPFLFSAAIFLFPMARALLRRRAEARAAAENGRRGVIAEISAAPDREHTPERLAEAYRRRAGRPAEKKALERLLGRLGGELDVKEDGSLIWRFRELAGEAAALEQARKAAPEDERRLGPVVFSSADPA